MCFADIFANFLNLKLTEVNCKDDLKNLIEIRLNFGKKLIISQLDICYQGWKVMFLFKAVLILTRVGGWSRSDNIANSVQLLLQLPNGTELGNRKI